MNKKNEPRHSNDPHLRVARGFNHFADAEESSKLSSFPDPAYENHSHEQMDAYPYHVGNGMEHNASDSGEKPVGFVGQLLCGRYQLLSTLGSGGMGKVFLAEDIRFGGFYALKMIHPWLLKNMETTSRFIQEFKLTAHLNHPGIIRTYSIDEDPISNLLFYTMEYIEGSSLQDIINQAKQHGEDPKFSGEETLRLLEKLGEIITYIHKKGVVHRDLKPANILFMADTKELKLVDFGLAKAFTESNPTLHTGHGGTFYYIAPEQLKGGEEVQPTADIFSLGVIAYQLLTGELPVAMAAPPSQLNPNLHKDVDEVMRKTMHPTTAKRFQTFEAFYQSLNNALKSPPRRKRKKHPSLPRMKGFLGNIHKSGEYYSASGSSEKSQPWPKSSSGNRIPLRENSPVPGQHLGFSLPLETQTMMEPNRSSLNRTTGSLLVNSLQSSQGHITALAWSPDGKLMASGGTNRTIKIWDASSWFQLHTLKNHQEMISALTWNPSGTQLLSASHDKTIKVWDIYSARQQMVLTHEAEVTRISYAPNGRFIVSGSRDGVIKVWEADTGLLIRTIKEHGGGITALHICPDSQVLVSGSEDKTIQLWDANTGKNLQIFEEYWTEVNAVLLSKGAEFLFSATDDATLKQWRSASGNVQQTFRGHQESVRCAALLKNGRYLLSGSEDKTLKLWEVETGSVLHTFYRHAQGVLALSVSEDQMKLISGGYEGVIKCWDLSPWLKPDAGASL